MNKINLETGEDQLGRTAIAYIVDGGTAYWLQANKGVGTNNYYGLSTKYGLFDIFCGSAEWPYYSYGLER